MCKIVLSRCIPGQGPFARRSLPSSAALLLMLACGMCHGQEMAASIEDLLPMRGGPDTVAESAKPLVDNRSKNTVDVGKAVIGLARAEAKIPVLRCWQD